MLGDALRRFFVWRRRFGLWARASAARFVGIWAAAWGGFVVVPRMVRDWPGQPLALSVFEVAFWLLGGILLGWVMWRQEAPPAPPESAS
ncbi:MAG TPA: hypothetical protein VH722_16065 [Alphaproteobacteria bacterium]|jgi:hypothetical protein|nr:hypothetical protein [Alphaproteobacteria bacterium]